MIIRTLSIILFFCVFVISGCVSVHKYVPTGNKILRSSKLSNKKFFIGEINVSEKNKEEINNPKIRLHSMTSPYNNSYGEYLKRALIMELVESQSFGEEDGLVISGTLLKNVITSPVTEQGIISISARIIVKEKEKTVFDEIISYETKWDVPFVGEYAIERGQALYMQTMRKFVERVFYDINFKIGIQ